MSLTVNTVDDHRAVVRVVDRVVLDVRVADGANHVEVDRVPSEPEALPRVAHFDVFDARSERLVAARVHLDVRAELVEL